VQIAATDGIFVILSSQTAHEAALFDAAKVARARHACQSA
jgi:hypothetical protein